MHEDLWLEGGKSHVKHLLVFRIADDLAVAEVDLEANDQTCQATGQTQSRAS